MMQRALALVFMITLLGAAASPAQEDRIEAAPAGLEAVDVTERPDAQAPLDLKFVDEDGMEVALGDFFHPGRPVILNLGYYSCPMLCGLVLNAMVDGMKELEWTPGQEFELITVSIDAREGPRLANLKKDTYLQSYGRPSARSGWHFLTGTADQSRALADAVGFGYAYNEERQEWMHPAALFVLTPEGRVARYLYGVSFDAQTLRLSLVEASEGRIGGSMDKVLLFCFQYDSSVGRYGPAARRLMSVAGYVTVVVLGLWLIQLRRRDRRRKS